MTFHGRNTPASASNQDSFFDHIISNYLRPIDIARAFHLENESHGHEDVYDDGSSDEEEAELPPKGQRRLLNSDTETLDIPSSPESKRLRLEDTRIVRLGELGKVAAKKRRQRGYMLAVSNLCLDSRITLDDDFVRDHIVNNGPLKRTIKRELHGLRTLINDHVTGPHSEDLEIDEQQVDDICDMAVEGIRLIMLAYRHSGQADGYFMLPNRTYMTAGIRIFQQRFAANSIGLVDCPDAKMQGLDFHRTMRALRSVSGVEGCRSQFTDAALELEQEILRTLGRSSKTGRQPMASLRRELKYIVHVSHYAMLALDYSLKSSVYPDVEAYLNEGISSQRRDSELMLVGGDATGSVDGNASDWEFPESSFVPDVRMDQARTPEQESRIGLMTKLINSVASVRSQITE